MDGLADNFVPVPPQSMNLAISWSVSPRLRFEDLKTRGVGEKRPRKANADIFIYLFVWDGKRIGRCLKNKKIGQIWDIYS